MSLILLGAVIVLGGYVIQQEQKITQLKHEMKEGNNIQCDPGYIAKVVQGPKVTCLMLRTAPGSVTNRIAKN